MFTIRQTVLHTLTTAAERLVRESKLAPVSMDPQIEEPADPRHGDFASNIALQLHRNSIGYDNPLHLAQDIVSHMKEHEEIDKAEAVAPGYINFYLNKRVVAEQLELISKDPEYGRPTVEKHKINVEFISANPTGPLHLGNGRGGYNGDVLANVLSYLGHDVTREYYINDGGGQVKKLAESIRAVKEGKTVEGGYGGEYIAELARSGDDSGEALIESILDGYLKPTTEQMGIQFDVWFSEEKELHSTGKVTAMLQLLKQHNLAYEAEEATWLKSTQFDDERDRVLVKSDGAPTYLLVDLAYHWNKFQERGFGRGINFWGADHAGQAPSLQAGLRALDLQDRLDIVIFQLVRLIKDGKEFKMSKREGNFVTMDDLLKMIGDEVGVQQAKDVVRYFFLTREHNTHMDFDLTLATEQSEKNPVFYIQYAYARTVGILKQAAATPETIDFSLLTASEELALIKKLTVLPEVLREISKVPYPVHKLPYYTYDLATLFHKFYREQKVVGVDPSLSAARVELVEATQRVVGRCLELMGLSIPTEGMYREDKTPKSD